ncbi:MAG: hypothetical protein ACI9X4_002396 [Glaciecola sp.]|jgi:hypothetical protein
MIAMNKRFRFFVLFIVLVGGVFWIWQNREGQGLPGQNRVALSENPDAAPDTSLPTAGTVEVDHVAPVELTEDTSEPGAVRQVLAVENSLEALRGTVKNQLGEPIPEFTLSARYKPMGKGSKWENREMGHFLEGRFALSKLEEGRWRFTPACEGYSAIKSKITKVPHKGDPLALVMSREAVLTGIVLDPDGKGTAGVKVVMMDKSKDGETVTDGDGRFRMTRKPGPYSGLARDDFFGSSEVVQGELAIGEVDDITLHLRLGARLEGEVQDFEGNVRAGWGVELHTSKFALDRRSVRSDEQGKFVIEHAAPGTYWVEGRSPVGEPNESRPMREGVELIEGQTAHVLLGGVSETSIRVTGTVYRDGMPAPEARVWADMEGPKAFSSSMTTGADESGRFELYFPEGGRANFLVATESSKLVPIPIFLSDEREQEIDIHVPNGQISGQVVQSGKGKFKPRMVNCSPEGRNPIHSLYLLRTIRCDTDGTFTFDYLPPGTYRVYIGNVIDPGSVADDVLVVADGHVKGLRLELGATGEATVKVVDDKGQTVVGASVFLQDAKGNAHAAGPQRKTNSTGEIRFSKLGVGDYRIFASHGEFSSTLSDVVQVTSDKPVTQTVMLAPGARGTIQVLDQADPVTARLWILNDAGHEFSRTMDSIDHTKFLREGYSSVKYELGPLLPGKYLVRARAFDGREAQGELLLEVGVPGKLELQLDP